MICYFCGDKFGGLFEQSDCPGVCNKPECNAKFFQQELRDEFLKAKDKHIIDNMNHSPEDFVYYHFTERKDP